MVRERAAIGRVGEDEWCRGERGGKGTEGVGTRVGRNEWGGQSTGRSSSCGRGRASRPSGVPDSYHFTKDGVM